MEAAEHIAEEHWQWLHPLLRYLYITAFTHGWKHCEEQSAKSSETAP